MAEPQRSLVRKLAEVMALVQRVPKTGYNSFHKYHYATEADILDAVREGLAERRVMIVPDAVAVEGRESKNGKDTISRLKVRFIAMDGDSGETFEFHAVGEGSDPGDKGVYKASTGAEKYALLKLFLIPTGDDPEQDEPEPRGRPAPPPAPTRPMPGAMAPPPAPKSAPGAPGLEEELGILIREAATTKQLEALVPRLEKLTPEARVRLRGPYGVRYKELSAGGAA